MSNTLSSALITLESIYDYLSEENHHIHHNKDYPPLHFLEKKSRLHEELDTLTQFLKTLNKSNNDTLLQKIQNKLLQLLVLNQENEQSLLQIGFEKQKQLHLKMSRSKATSIYKSI